MEKEKYEINVSENTTSIKKKQVEFKSYFKIDSSLTKRDSVNITIVSNGENKQRLLSICNCEKNKKKNTIKIQLTSAIPTKSELKNGEKGSRLFMDIGNPGSFKGQIKTITFFLKDSLIEKIDFISKSTDKDYGDLGYEYMNPEKYHIKISKMNYSIASDIFGTYELILPKGYGYLKNDSIVKGTFECNNWRVNKLEDLKNLDLDKWNEQKKKSRGIQIYE
jgi:hypothetical protein